MSDNKLAILLWFLKSIFQQIAYFLTPVRAVLLLPYCPSENDDSNIDATQFKSTCL